MTSRLPTLYRTLELPGANPLEDAHAAMAGKTGLVIGHLHDRIIRVPIELPASRKKHLGPDGFAWSAVLAATGQRERFEQPHESP